MGLREYFDVVAGPQLDQHAETKAETIARARSSSSGRGAR